MLDNYTMKLKIKGGFTISNWDTIYITSNVDVDSWYYNICDNDREALKNRIIANCEVNR